MSYFAVCTFDLKNANYDDYQKAYSDLAQIGLNKQLNSSQGSTITLPTTTTAGEYYTYVVIAYNRFNVESYSSDPVVVKKTKKGARKKKKCWLF